METADYLLNKVGYLSIKSRTRKKLAWDTHYVGDIRTVHNNFLDSSQFKSLSILETYEEKFIITKDNNSVFINGEKFDIVIRCLGFKFDESIFDDSIKPNLYKNKIPIIKNNFMSENISNLYFGGSLTQYNGYRTSTLGFIHGFRYALRYIARNLIQEKNNKIVFKATVKSINNILYNILKVVNENSCIFQLFENFCYVFIFKNECIIDYKEMPINIILNNTNEDRLIITYEYNLKPEDDNFDNYIFSEDYAGYISRIFHPVLRFIPKGINSFKNTKIQCLCGNFDDYEHINQFTICKKCMSEAICPLCIEKDLIKEFKNNKCRRCNSLPPYEKNYHKFGNYVYRYDFMEIPDNLYPIYNKSVNRFFEFILNNNVINVENTYIDKIFFLKNKKKILEEFSIDDQSNMISINNKAKAYIRDVIDRPIQRNFLFKNCIIYPKTDTKCLDTTVQDTKDLEKLQLDLRRRNSLILLINYISEEQNIL